MAAASARAASHEADAASTPVGRARRARADRQRPRPSAGRAEGACRRRDRRAGRREVAADATVRRQHRGCWASVGSRRDACRTARGSHTGRTQSSCAGGGNPADTDPRRGGEALARAVRDRRPIPLLRTTPRTAAARDDEVEALEPEAFRRGLHDAFATWLSSLAAESPLVVAIEDAHWADPSSLDLTRELDGAERRRPLVLYVTAGRESQSALDEAPVADGGQLDPLDEIGDRGLGATCSRGRAAGLVPWVIERTTGNPFFVEELVRSLLEPRILTVPTVTGSCSRMGGGRRTADRRGPARGPHRPPSESRRRGAATASVIGRVMPIPLLDGVLGREATRELAILVDRALLDHVTDERGPTVAFHHALVLDVAYARLLRRQQRSLHRRVAEVAEALHGSGDDVVDLLARHLYLGEAGTKAIEDLARAGERAARLYANQEAIVHLSRAMELARARAGPGGASNRDRACARRPLRSGRRLRQRHQAVRGST